MRAVPDLFFGSIALKNRMLTRDQLAAALREQDVRARAGRAATLGAICRDLGLLKEEDVNAILWAQAKSEVLLEDKLCGRIAVRNGLVSETDLASALEEQSRRGPGARLGAILVERGKLTEQQLAAILRAQKRLHDSGRLAPATAGPAPGAGEPRAARLRPTIVGPAAAPALPTEPRAKKSSARGKAARPAPAKGRKRGRRSE
jgi:hypothetical protein